MGFLSALSVLLFDPLVFLLHRISFPRPAPLAGGRLLKSRGDLLPESQRERSGQPAATQAVSYTAVQVANLYGFPPNTTGAGETVGIIELGGGFETSDLDSFFQSLGISAPPQVVAVSVDGVQNVPGADPTGADGRSRTGY